MPKDDFPFYSEQPVPRLVAVLIIAMLGAFAAGAFSAAVVAFGDDDTGIGIALAVFGLLLTVLCVLAFAKYIARGARGHYIRIRSDLLEAGEVDGRVQHSIPIDAIRKTEYHQEPSFRLKVFTDVTSFSFSEFDLEPETYAELEKALLERNPNIVVYDNSGRTNTPASSAS